MQTAPLKKLLSPIVEKFRKTGFALCTFAVLIAAFRPFAGPLRSGREGQEPPSDFHDFARKVGEAINASPAGEAYCEKKVIVVDNRPIEHEGNARQHRRHPFAEPQVLA